MPVSLVLLLLARLTPAGTAPEDLSVLGRIHIMLVTVGVGVFALASALSAIYLVEDRALKKKRFDALSLRDKAAPLEGLDRMAHRLIWVGFPIFTVALVLGAVWSRQDSCWRGLPRARSTALAGRGRGASTRRCSSQGRSTGWRGRRCAARLTLAGFAVAILRLDLPDLRDG